MLGGHKILGGMARGCPVKQNEWVTSVDLLEKVIFEQKSEKK